MKKHWTDKSKGMNNLADRLAGLSRAKRALIELRLKKKEPVVSGEQRIPQREKRSSAPLSFAQQRLWFLNQMGTGSAYNIYLAIRLNGLLNIKALEESLNEIIRRHEALRTTFRSTGGRPVQVIAENISLEMPLIDLSGQPKAERAVEAKRLTRDETMRRFDLVKGPLFNAVLIRLFDEDHILLLTMHHIVSDGWSLGVFTAELAALYKAFCNGEASPLPELPIQYADFAHWQREWLQGEVLENQLSYWRKQLEGVPVLQLFTDRPRPAVQTFEGASQNIALSPTLTRALNDLSQRQGVTLFITLLAAFQTLLFRYTGQEDIVVGSPIANRNRTEIEGLIGFFVNSLAMRTDLSGNPSFLELLGRVGEVAFGAFAHQDLPFEKLVEELHPERDMSRTPLFQIMFALQNMPAEELQLPGLTLSSFALERITVRFDIEIHLMEKSDGLSGRVVYNTDILDDATIARLMGHYETLLESIVADPDQRISDVQILTDTERQQLLIDWNDTSSKYPRDRCVHQLFEEQVEQSPDAVAVVYGDEQLTYRELNTRANQLAHYLKGFGVGPEVLVGICLERSIEMIIALMGILKAGGAYVPLDPEYPQERLSFMLADTGSPMLLTHRRLVEALPRHVAKVICIDSDWDAIARHSGETPVSAMSVENLAYVIYTSGSTGKPKGVAISHGGLLNLVFWHRNVFEITASDRAAQLAGTAFDASVWEIWPYLTAGARLHVVSAEKLVAPEQLRDWLVSEEITLTFLPTPLAEQVLKLDWPQQTPLRTLLTGGDKLHRSPPESIPFKVVNNYGPTENTVVTTSGLVLPNSDADIQPPIGCPISNIEVYVLDERLRPVPVGVPGELCIGGESLARGYLNHPNLTAENFIPNPYSDTLGARLYKSGDLVRYLQDGSIEFLGRKDFQVKLRGFRIELGEIEAVLGQHPDVQEAVVVVREDPQGEKRLVGYMVSAQEAVSPGELRQHLKQTLPEYMVPAIFMKLDALPLTPNGKVDRRALPMPEGSQPQVDTDFVAPRSSYEEAVAEIWRDSLGLEQVGIYDNFFDLGGHSLLVTKIVSRLKTTFGVDIPLRAFFDSPTIAELSATLTMARRGEERTEKAGIQPVARNGTLPLSFAQERFWVLDQFHTNSAVFSGSRGFRLRGPFQLEVFRESVQALVDRHEILRTTFASVDGRPHQVIAPTLSVEVSLQNCSGLSKEEQAGMIQQAYIEEKRFQFDLAHGPLFHARLLRFAEDDHFLVLNFHHIILDAWSLEVIFKDLVTAYTAGCAGHTVTLPALPIQYADYAHWQRELLEGPTGREQLAFWKTQLAQLPPALPLPTDYARPAVQTFRGARESLQLSAELLAPLRALNRQEGTTLFMVLLATLQFLLHRLTGTHDILIGSPISGRDQQELHGLIGCFLNTLVLRTDLSGALTGRDLLKRVREVVLNAFENQDVPFEKILAEVDPVRDLSRTPIFQVLLNMHSFDDQHFPLPELSVTRVLPTDINSLFDMTLYFLETTDEIRISLVYNADLFTAGRMKEFMRQFKSILEQMINDPDRPLEAFTLVTPSVRLYLPDPQQPLDAEWEGSVWSRIEHHAHQQGEAIAIVSPGETWTYQDLEARSNQLAHYLLEQGIQAQEVVAIYASRSPELVLALLGILKAGAAFMILDPSYPSARLLEMLQIAGPCCFIYLEEAGPLPDEVDAWADRVPCRVRLPAFIATETDFEELWGSTPKTAPGVKVQPDDVAYVTFTSGSTGTPKCLQGTHRPLSHFMRWYTQALQLTAADRVTMFSGLAHDPLLRDVFTPLWNGGTLCIPDQEALALGRVGDWMYEQKITLMHLTPPLVDVLTVGRETSQESCTSLRYAVFGGESLRPIHLDCIKQLAPQATCVNGYGATETPQIMCWYVVPPEFPSNREQVPIGQGIDGAQILVLNNAGQLAGIGEFGEIYIRTPYLTLGYVNDEALMSARFLQNPFRPEAGDRMYRTGDMGRLLPDGSIEFAGRMDFQVKIRGFRIEVGEVEVVLGQHPAVEEVVVVPGEDSHGDRLLIAYLVINENPSPSISEIHSVLKQKFPEYMIPSAFVFIDALPRTPSGKVDHLALPEPNLERFRLETKFVAPRTQAEKVLAKIWGEVLGLERVGVHDNFFELGGHSLLATQVMSRARDNFEMEFPLLRLFEIPTIAGLTELIETIRLTEQAPRSYRETTTSDREAGEI